MERERAVDNRYCDGPTLQFIADTFEEPQAWTREHLSPADWLIRLSDACLAELHEAIRAFRIAPCPIPNLSPDTLSLAACMAAMAKVRTALQQTGLAVLDRVPVAQYSPDENKAIAWLLSRMLGPIVSQKLDGTTLYNVKDSGKALGYGVRRSVTNLEQSFHTDGGWLTHAPEVVGLFCLQPAQEGGSSRVVSLITVHHVMQQRYSDLLSRLYQPFCWDRQAEHGPDEARYSRHPVYQYDGRMLTARYYEDYIFNGYKLAGASLDRTGAAALEAMRTVIEAPEHGVEFSLGKGQIAFINNQQCAHARTAFRDADALHLRRHIVRLWNRRIETPTLEG